MPHSETPLPSLKTIWQRFCQTKPKKLRQKKKPPLRRSSGGERTNVVMIKSSRRPLLLLSANGHSLYARVCVALARRWVCAGGLSIFRRKKVYFWREQEAQNLKQLNKELTSERTPQDDARFRVCVGAAGGRGAPRAGPDLGQLPVHRRHVRAQDLRGRERIQGARGRERHP